MPTYEYECRKCGIRFERQQSIADAPLVQCPECGGAVRRLVSGGGGFISRASNHGGGRQKEGGCSLESSGATCCGRGERCAKPPCGGKRS